MTILRIIALILAAYFVFRLAKKGVARYLGGVEPSKKLGQPSLIQCEQCGTYFDRQSTVHHKKKNFCSLECAETYRVDPT